MINNLNVNGLKYFQEISKIPRGSGNMKAISDYIKNFGENLGLKVIQDEALNVIIFKDGTGTSKEPVILQSHIDMVCEKDSTHNHDFLKDEIELIVEGDFIHANHTTLGADNGVAVAYCMQLLADKTAVHPPLEVVFTTDEETGLYGAHALDMSIFKGKKLINIDNEEEGIFVVSCAGGRRVDINLPIEMTSIDSSYKSYKIHLHGLLGGHSGVDIIKERANANVLMGRLLLNIKNSTDFNIISINGGAQDNAIPRECFLEICVPKDYDLNGAVNSFLNIVRDEFTLSDKNINIDVTDIDKSECFTKELSKKVVQAILLLPNGIQNMNVAIEGLPETSTNIGVIITENGLVTFRSALRSANATRIELLSQKMVTISDVLGGSCTLKPSYPGWNYKEESALRETFKEAFFEQNGRQPVIEAIHAGLECGIFAGKIENLDIISFGPSIFDPHTPKEKIDYKSMDRSYDLLIIGLRKLAN